MNHTMTQEAEAVREVVVFQDIDEKGLIGVAGYGSYCIVCL